MIATRKRVPALFRWDVRDGLGANGKLVARSYGAELEGVFTRAGVKYVADKNGLLIPVAHSTPAFGYVRDADGALVQGLLLEPARTNLVTHSDAPDNVAWTATRSSVSANTDRAPDGTLTADRLVEDTSVGTSHVISSAAMAITANGNVCVSRFLKAGPRSWARLGLSDAGGTVYALAYFDVGTGATGSTHLVGTGTVVDYGIEPWGDDWYRCWVVVNLGGGITSARHHMDSATGDGGADYTGDGASYIILGGAQVEDGALVPSSYIPTGATAVTRAADALYFPFLAVPQEMTAYVKGVNLGQYSGGNNGRTLHIGSSNVSLDPRVSLGYIPATNAIYALYDDGVAGPSTASVTSESVAHGDTIEHRGVVTAEWRGESGVSVNGGAEVMSALGVSGAAQQDAFADDIVHFAGTNEAGGGFAFQQVVIAAGTKTMDEMRVLAEVD